METSAAIAIPVDRPALKQNYFGTLPRSEVFARRYYGRNVDLQAIENAIRSAENGVMGPITDLARESKRNDPALEGMIAKRVGAVAFSDWTISPAKGGDPARAQQIAEDVRRALERIDGFKQSIYDLAYAIFDGRAALEIEWQVSTTPTSSVVEEKKPRRGPYWYPTALRWIHPGRLSFGPQRELRVVERHRQSSLYWSVGPALQEVPGKFIWWMPRMFNDYPEREGLAPRILYWSFFKRFSWRHRMILTELFGLPWRIIERDKEAPTSPEQLDDDEEAAESLGGTTVAAMSPGSSLKIHPPHPESGTLFGMTSTDVNEECAKLIHGQSKTTEGDVNRSAGVVLQTEEDRIRQRDGGGLGERFQQQLVNVFVQLNYSVDDLFYTPTFALRTEPPRDRKAELERVEKVVSLGVPVSEAEVYELSGLRRPIAGEAVITNAATKYDPTGRPVGPVAQVDPDGLGGPAKPTASALPGDVAAPAAADESSGTDDLVQQVLDAFDADMLNEPDSGEEDAQVAAVRLAGPRQPETVHGSPETLIERGVREGLRETEAWAKALAEATGGVTKETALFVVLQRAAARLPLERITRALERRIVHSLMLGALDADWEAKKDQPIALPKFTERTAEGRITLDTGIAGFVTKPFGEAIKAFASKKVVSRRAFERLAAEAKRRAFTVAGLAKQEMLDVAHDELTKAISSGDDLTGFRSALEARFESAGWTALNPSHVETVFRNGVMGAYAKGRDEQMRQPEVLAARPYWQVLGVKDDRTRRHHAAAHGKALAADDPFWSRAPLPWGHNCRCRKVSRSPDDLKRLGLTVTTGAELVGLPDEGWDAGPK